VVGSSEEFLVLVADLPEGAVDTPSQAVVLTRYIETFSTRRTSQHIDLVSRKSGTSEFVQSRSHCVAVRHQRDQVPRRILRNSSGGSGKSVLFISSPSA
jgi:hypothetical protein